MPSKSTSGRSRGRPAHKPTPTLRLRVSTAAGGGMRHIDIATALGISRETLEKYYETELSVGANLRRMEALHGLHQAAKRGSAAAVKAYLSLTPDFAVPPLPAHSETPAPPPAPAAAVPSAPAKRLGKKEQATADAGVAQFGTGWDGLLPGKAPLQ